MAKKRAPKPTVRPGTEGRYRTPPGTDGRAWYAPSEEGVMRDLVLVSPDQSEGLTAALLLHNAKSVFSTHETTAALVDEGPLAGEFPFYDRARGAGGVREVDPDEDMGWSARTLSAFLRVAQRDPVVTLEAVYQEAGVKPVGGSARDALGRVARQAVVYEWVDAGRDGRWDSRVYCA